MVLRQRGKSTEYFFFFFFSRFTIVWFVSLSCVSWHSKHEMRDHRAAFRATRTCEGAKLVTYLPKPISSEEAEKAGCQSRQLCIKAVPLCLPRYGLNEVFQCIFMPGVQDG